MLKNSLFKDSLIRTDERLINNKVVAGFLTGVPGPPGFLEGSKWPNSLPCRSTWPPSLTIRSTQSPSLPCRSTRSPSLPVRRTKSPSLPCRRIHSHSLPVRRTRSPSLPSRRIRRIYLSQQIYMYLLGNKWEWLERGGMENGNHIHVIRGITMHPKHSVNWHTE